MSVADVGVNEMADALLIKISIPPNFSTACWTAVLICASSRTSTIHGKALPPAASISAAAV